MSEAVERFRAAVADITEVQSRVEAGQQFNTYDLDGGGYTVGIGPVTNLLSLMRTNGAAVAELVEASLRLSTASLTGEVEPVAWPDRPTLDIPALQREVAGIIVRDVLQEDYDDLVEGYLDEIMRASLRIIRLPGYSVVARAFETNISASLISAGDELDKAKAENARMREALEQIADGSAPPIPHGHYLAHRHAVDLARVALSVKAG